MKKTKNRFYVAHKRRYSNGFLFTVELQRDFEKAPICRIYADNAIKPFGKITVLGLNVCPDADHLKDIIEIMENFEEYVAHLK